MGGSPSKAWHNSCSSLSSPRRFFFFFQAEDGIRDYKVTGVQTCALPICRGRATCGGGGSAAHHRHRSPIGSPACQRVRSEEHTSELQSPCNLVCRLLLAKKKTQCLLRLYTQPEPLQHPQDHVSQHRLSVM